MGPIFFSRILWTIPTIVIRRAVGYCFAMTKVYTGGVFDLLHKGHFLLLARAKALGDYLVVGVQSDEAVCLVPGKRRPILSTQERIEQMRALPFADAVVVYGSSLSTEAIDAVRPDVFVHGDDWTDQTDRRPMMAELEKRGIRLVLLPRTPGVSDSEIMQRVAAALAAAPDDCYKSKATETSKEVHSA